MTYDDDGILVFVGNQLSGYNKEGIFMKGNEYGGSRKIVF